LNPPLLLGQNSPYDLSSNICQALGGGIGGAGGGGGYGGGGGVGGGGGRGGGRGEGEGVSLKGDGENDVFRLGDGADSSDDADGGSGGSGSGGGSGNGGGRGTCFPPLKRAAHWGVYATLPTFNESAYADDLKRLLNVSIDADGAELAGALVEADVANDPKALDVSGSKRKAHCDHLMQTLRLPVDCTVEAGDAITTEATRKKAPGNGGTEERRAGPALGSCAVVFPTTHLVGAGAGRSWRILLATS